MLRTADLDYPLPEGLIATTPAEPRDAARLLVVSRTEPLRLEHRIVRELPEILRPRETRAGMAPDLMIVNSTRVLPARFKGIRPDTGGRVEGLYLGRVRELASSGPAAGDEDRRVWNVLLKMRRMKPGVVVRLFDPAGNASAIQLRLLERTDENAGSWNVAVESDRDAEGETSSQILDRIGLTPIPPYILASRRKSLLTIPDARDRTTYQTVYSDKHEPPGHGSVAAPTAGLHFTPELLDRLRSAGVHRAEVSLDVSLGTFKPVETEFVEQHPMHREWCHVPGATAVALKSLRGMNPSSERGGRVIAVGTTAARTLESFDSLDRMVREPCQDTDLLIAPGYAFKHIDALLTNFHLPQSTLLALVAAFLTPPEGPAEAGLERVKAIYAEAVGERYRFYSFGDAMLILP